MNFPLLELKQFGRSKDVILIAKAGSQQRPVERDVFYIGAFVDAETIFVLEPIQVVVEHDQLAHRPVKPDLSRQGF